LIGLPVGHRRRTVRALARRGDIPAASIAHFLRPSDIVAAAWQSLTMRFDLGAVRLPDGVGAAPYIAAEIAQERGSMFQGLLIERALARALVRHPRARVIHTYENNPWERAVDGAAHGASPRRDVIGYLHCAVLPSHLKNFVAPEETAIRPAPDRIVCTGPAAREVFLRLGAHDPARVLAGGALRGPALSQLAPRRSPPGRVHTVLALLEGLTSMTALLRFLAAAAPAGGRRILIRPHPVMPLGVLLPAAGISLDPAHGLDESRAPALADAIAEAQAVIYQSSTAAMTALALGVPLIKVRLPGALEDDPLFACDALKRVVDRPDRLAAALDDVECMDQPTFDTELARARGYLDRYLAPVDDTALACFAGPGGWENASR
jgi:surface carbohydrate biosynthesis protein (TIGR04326 family)